MAGGGSGGAYTTPSMPAQPYTPSGPQAPQGPPTTNNQTANPSFAEAYNTNMAYGPMMADPNQKILLDKLLYNQGLMLGGGQTSWNGSDQGGGQHYQTKPLALGPAAPGMADGGSVQSFMGYPQQGQPNLPQPGANIQPPAFGATPQNQNFMQGPDVTGSLPGGGMGFDNSGSDGGVGGQPAPMQSPLQQGNKPLGLAQFQRPQGLQIQGNPTSQVVGRPQQR